MATRAELEAKFRRLGVDFSRPGFYDDPEFIRAERAEPNLLVDYARYVKSLEFSQEYLARVRPVILEAADFLYRSLLADGRRGACIDVSGILLRCLEREGIWSHFVGGGLKVQFPEGARLPPRWFWPLMHARNPAMTGHAWISAPPFNVVDISYSLQPYVPREQEYLRGFVAVEQCGVNEAPTIRDLMENEAVEEFVQRRGRLPEINDLPQITREFLEEFPSCALVKDGVRLNYIPVRTSAPDLPLERMRNLQLSGRYPLQLYEEFRRGRR